MSGRGSPILLVAQLAPPSTLVAARRVAGLTKYLARGGLRVVVLTSRISGSAPIEGADAVLRTNDLLVSRLNWRRGHFEALTGGTPGRYARPSRLEAVVVPDLAAPTWLPFAIPEALRLARQRSLRCVVTTSPPPSAHFVGLALRRRGVRWIAEFRDGWTFEPPHPPWPSALQRRLDATLERRVLQNADAVVGVTAPIADDLRRRYGADARLITNGFDPDELTSAAVDGSPLDPHRHSFVHTGRMGIARVGPRPLLDAVRLAVRDDPAFAERAELVFAGPLTQEEDDLLAAPDVARVVRRLGWLERPRALQLQRAADTLILITEGTTRRSVATGKLFEYLGSGRPILVLGAGTEAARIVAEADAGIAVPATDPEAIAIALRELVARPRPHGASAEAAARYAYPQIAAALAALIEEIAPA